MRRFFINIEYIGENYGGFQVQKNAKLPTVQGLMQEALKQVFGKKITLIASGRLDKGVNALNLPAHFDVDTNISASKIAPALNAYLPRDIRVKKAVEVPHGLHARFSAKHKTYSYMMYISPVELPHLEKDATRLFLPPDIKLMKKGAKYIKGKKDFTSFMSKNSSIKDATRVVKRLKIKQIDNVITLQICADGFLYNMARIIVGTLLDVGYKKKTPKQIKEIIKAKNRKFAGKMVSAKGLYLVDVEYGRKFTTILED